jgi:S1-C subfamily serine protease
MARNLQYLITAALACLALHGRPAAAQERVSGAPAPAGARGANLGFAYAWTGGITVGPNGEMRKKNPPHVNQVVPGSVGERAGIRAGDVIVSVNGRDSRAMPMFGGVKPGDTIVLRIRRGNEEREISYLWPR